LAVLAPIPRPSPLEIASDLVDSHENKTWTMNRCGWQAIAELRQPARIAARLGCLAGPSTAIAGRRLDALTDAGRYTPVHLDDKNIMWTSLWTTKTT